MYLKHIKNASVIRPSNTRTALLVLGWGFFNEYSLRHPVVFVGKALKVIPASPWEMLIPSNTGADALDENTGI